MDECASDIPQRLHSRDTAEDGDPEWHVRFRGWLLCPPFAADRDGYVHSPLKYWLWVMTKEGRRKRVQAEYLYRLGVMDGDWLAAARTFTPLTHDGELFAEAFATDSLQVFWGFMQRPTPAPATPRHGDCAASGCTRRTTRYYCAEHGPKSESQIKAEESA